MTPPSRAHIRTPTEPSESDRLIRLRLTGGDDAPRRARTALRSLLDGHVTTTAAWDAELVVSELVTNSVRHANVRGHEAVTLEILTLDDRVRIAVTDPGSKLKPRSVAPDPGTPGGFGLFLVETLSDSWGVGRDGVGPTRVWCELLFDRSRVAG